MQNVVVSKAEMRVLSGATKSSSEALASARYIFAELQQYFSADSHKKSGLVFEPQGDSRIICNIVTPCGVGRAVFGYALGEQSIDGHVSIERQRYANDDSVVWEQVISIAVPAEHHLNPFFVTKDGEEVGILTKIADHDDDYWRSLMVAGHSIFRAIIQGPILN